MKSSRKFFVLVVALSAVVTSSAAEDLSEERQGTGSPLSNFITDLRNTFGNLFRRRPSSTPEATVTQIVYSPAVVNPSPPVVGESNQSPVSIPGVQTGQGISFFSVPNNGPTFLSLGSNDQNVDQSQQQLVQAQLIGSQPERPPTPQVHQQLQAAYDTIPTTVIGTAYVTKTVTVTRENRFCRFFNRNSCNSAFNVVRFTRV